MRPLLRLLVVLLVTIAMRPLLLDAQVRPIYDRGTAGLTLLLQRLQTTASALHTGAHPDDEDSAFMARAAPVSGMRRISQAAELGGGRRAVGRPVPPPATW